MFVSFLFVVRKMSFGKTGYGESIKQNPLIRKVNGDNEIEGLNIGTTFTRYVGMLMTLYS